MADVIMPKMGDAMEAGTLIQWLRQDGESVKIGDVIAEIETDKSNVEIEAEDAGILHVQARAGENVKVGGVIAVIGDAPAAKTNGAGKPAAEVKPMMTTAPQKAVNGQNAARVKASPLARRIAREQNIDIAQVTGTGPSGRIVEADVMAFAQNKPAETQSAPSTAVQTGLPAATPTVETPQKRADLTPAPVTSPTELSAIRKVIAKRMVESKTTIPHFYITSEIDMTEAISLREKLNGYDETLAKISFNDMVVKASALALKKVPAANASFKDDKIMPGAGVHVGIAVALDDGLIVPVVRDADALPLRKLATASKDLIKKARDKKVQPAEYSNGTFTVSNLGNFDVENFVAIIDPAQGAILAVASIAKKPVVLPGTETIAARSMMNVTFSGDHRVMDGATGAKFLQEFKRALQNPLSLLEG